MTLQNILELYFNDTKTREIAQGIKTKTGHMHLKGLSGSSHSFVFSSVFKHLERKHLIILNDKEEAAYFLNDLENLVGENQVLFFPSSYRRAYHVEDTDNANILLRAEVLSKINQSKEGKIIVTYPEAISEKVVTQQHLQKNTLELHAGETISIDFISEVFIEYGFERVDFVIEPGQFSIRGGIVDVFSFANDNPYRIEFFGDDVDSIRSFDAVTQLSIKNYDKIIIIPNVQGKILQESRTGFIDFISAQNTSEPVIWIKDLQFALDKIKKEFDNAEHAFSKLESAIKRLSPIELYTSEEEFKRHFSGGCTIEFGTQHLLKAEKTIYYNTTPQPTFNKNFELLAGNLKENSDKKIHNIIFADTEKQASRLSSIFEDIGKNTDFATVFLSLHEGFIDKDLSIACYTDHQIFDRYHRFKLKSNNFQKNDAITLKEIYGLNPGDYVTHIDHGVGKFAGLEKIEVNGKMQESIRLVYKDNDILYVSIHSLHRIAKFTGKEGHQPKLNKLGSNAWANLKQKTKKKVKEIAFDLIKLYAKRKTEKGFAYSPDTYLQHELEASFIYEDTPDQEKATIDVKRDMESLIPMDRLICGDVGFGKTEIAVRAAFKAVADSKQVAVLVPTTILALQHYKTFKERLKNLPCNVDYINRFKSAKEQKETIKKLEEGSIDILIGTHRLIGKDIKFKNLGLMIIDEEQKFGVAAKDKLKVLRESVDALTLTATPIPRTLQFSLMGARDLSVINTPPPNRHPVQTELHTFNEEIIRDAISFEISRGGQVFFVHNRVQNIQEVAGMIQRLCPDVKVAVGHGQMDGDKLEAVMLDFINGDFDVLVATTIIESGLDISNANTIIINQANMFGLSDLHQMRGRVGRSNKKAFCYLLCPPLSTLTEDARKRLTAIEQFSDLGSGFNIAMRDLDIRGAGDMLGGEQTGFINEIGFDTYQKILAEAVEELKEEEFKELFENTRNDNFKEASKANNFVKDCVIDTDMEILIPDYYISNITERLNLYKDLDNIEHEEDLLDFSKNLKDRFGDIPEQTNELINTIRLRNVAKKIGLEKLVLKNEKLVGYFISNQSSPFYQSENFMRILKDIQQFPQTFKLKQTNEKLMVISENISSVNDALNCLQALLN